jgi:hypothetical protein
MSAWYEGVRALITHEFPRGITRLGATLLLDAVNDLKLRDESEECRNARYWFAHPDDCDISLRMVCKMLDLKVPRLQSLALSIYSVNRFHMPYYQEAA